MGGVDRLLAVGLDGRAHFISWGPFQISLANLVVIALIVVLSSWRSCCRFPSRGTGRDHAGRQPGRAPHLDEAGA